MKLDDRDIVCEQDYAPLSNAELVAAIERYAAIMHTAPLIDFDLERITGPARALLARAEAAEADRDDAVAVELSDVLILLGLDPNDFELDQMRGVTHGVIDAMRQRNDALAARVAELEAQLAAQGWRPVTDYPANGQEVDLIVPATYYQAEYDPFTAEMMLAGYYLSDDGDMLRTLPTHWRPRPSPSIAAEATE